MYDQAHMAILREPVDEGILNSDDVVVKIA